jgi:hypothetical protein
MLLEIVFSRWKEKGVYRPELLLLCSNTLPSLGEPYFNDLIYCNFKEIGRVLPASAGSRIRGNHFCCRLEADMTVRRFRGGIGGPAGCCGFVGSSGDGLLFPRAGVQRCVSATAHREPPAYSLGVP